MFYVGQKVVFVGDREVPLSYYRERCTYNRGVMPEYGEVYTIRSMFTEGARKGESLVRLAEIDNSALAPTTLGRIEPGYPGRCFRPLVSDESDISIFTDMLKPKTEQVAA